MCLPHSTQQYADHKTNNNSGNSKCRPRAGHVYVRCIGPRASKEQTSKSAEKDARCTSQKFKHGDALPNAKLTGAARLYRAASSDRREQG